MKLKLTIECEYEVKSKYYPTNDIKEMADIDLRNFEDDPPSIMLLLEEESFKINVEPV